MVFNPDMCEHTNKRNVIQTSYYIHGQTLKETSKAKYLEEVTIDSNLSWNSHINTVTKGPARLQLLPPADIFQTAQRMLKPNDTSTYFVHTSSIFGRYGTL